MEPMLFRILYCSRNLTQTLGDRQSGDLDQILVKARRNNQQRSVTGALVYSAGFFAQVLEGPRTEIESTFERIQRDHRHGDVTVLESGSIPFRDFPAWSMAHVEPVSPAQADITETTLHDALDQPSTTSGQSVLELLRSLVIQEDWELKPLAS